MEWAQRKTMLNILTLGHVSVNQFTFAVTRELAQQPLSIPFTTDGY